MQGMEIRLGLLADAATKSGSKLNLLGVFDRFLCKEFPAVHPRLALVMRMVFKSSESGKTRDIEIELVDEDGTRITGMKGTIEIPKIEGTREAYDDMILELQNLKLPKAGPYEFHIVVGGEHKFTIPVHAEDVGEGKDKGKDKRKRGTK